jgi:hypothetical protein
MRVEGKAAAAIARELDYGSFIGGIGAGKDFADLLVIGIEAASEAGGGGP